MTRAPETRTEAELELAVEVLRTYGELRFVARGASMLPEIYPGDVLLVSREPAASLRCGHVVLATRGGRFYAHRVIRKLGEEGRHSFVTRGDALRDDDPPVGERELLGRITALIRDGKKSELGETPMAGHKLLRWAVRNSDGLAAWLLRWNALRARIARRTGATPTGAASTLVECP